MRRPARAVCNYMWCMPVRTAIWRRHLHPWPTLRVGGLVIGSDAFFTSRAQKLASLATNHRIPAVYWNRDFANAGGLMSYGTSYKETYRIAGIYTGRLLKGERPAELPVQQNAKVELVINIKTAKALGITFPLTLLARADEVIE
jgi:putative tryptophan/tyrosine transport system substrate-binding protein